MRYGFKSQAEKLSISIRAELQLSEMDQFPVFEFLKSKGIVVWTPAQIPNIEPDSVKQLTEIDPSSWSGATICEGNQKAIIINSAHSKTRQLNTLMHEWAHLELRHKPNRADRSIGGLLLLSDYPADVEDEADWLAGAMLLPRQGILHFRLRDFDINDIALHYGVSTELATWRIRMTGVNCRSSDLI